jgi:hypothetical protein
MERSILGTVTTLHLSSFLYIWISILYFNHFLRCHVQNRTNLGSQHYLGFSIHSEIQHGCWANYAFFLVEISNLKWFVDLQDKNRIILCSKYLELFSETIVLFKNKQG